MPVAARPRVQPDPRKAGSPARRWPKTGRRPSPSPSSRRFTVVESIQRPTPAWLPWVMRLQRSTTPIAIATVGLVVVLYGIHSRMEQRWSQTYQTLSEVQTERSTLADQAARLQYRIPQGLEIAPKNFVEQTPNNSLFLQPESARPSKSQEQTPRESLLRNDRLPVGY